MDGSPAPDDAALTIDVDSTICEVSGKAKAASAYGHTEQVGYHPRIAARADTGEDPWGGNRPADATAPPPPPRSPFSLPDPTRA